MTDAWYGESATEEDKLYEESVKRIKAAVAQGLSFEQAQGILDIKDAGLKTAIAEDALKVLIVEMHFSGGKPLEEVAKTLKLPLKKLKDTKAAMLKEVEAAAIEAYKSEMGKKGSA